LDCDCISAKNAFSACSAPIPPIEQGCRKSAFVARAPNPGFFTHVAQRFASIESSQLAWVVCKRSQFEAQFTLRQEADDERFLGSAGRAAKQFCQGLKLSHGELRQFKFVLSFRRKIVDEFKKQILGRTHQIIPACSKEK
jgi:hypothetical protein